MSKKRIFLTGVIALMMCGITTMNAQVTIGEDKAPQPFSVLELISKNTLGLRLPHLTTDQRNKITTDEFKANKLAEGLTIFNITTKCVNVWNGKVWIEKCADGTTTYTVSFDAGNGTNNGSCTLQICTQQINTGENATEPQNPTPPAGKKFDYWEDANTGLPFDFNTPITDNVNLIAYYSNLTATLDENGGTLNSPPTITAGTDGKITQPNDPTPPTGMEFLYWEDTNTGLPFDFNSPITDNVNLIAKYCTLITPTFTQIDPICAGGTFALPTTSNNGITGTWSPAINTAATTTYTFTPTAGQCATTATMTVTVNPLVVTITSYSPASGCIDLQPAGAGSSVILTVNASSSCDLVYEWYGSSGVTSRRDPCGIPAGTNPSTSIYSGLPLQPVYTGMSSVTFPPGLGLLYSDNCVWFQIFCKVYVVGHPETAVYSDIWSIRRYLSSPGACPP